jgi:hypothetical protein
VTEVDRLPDTAHPAFAEFRLKPEAAADDGTYADTVADRHQGAVRDLEDRIGVAGLIVRVGTRIGTELPALAWPTALHHLWAVARAGVTDWLFTRTASACGAAIAAPAAAPGVVGVTGSGGTFGGAGAAGSAETPGGAEAAGVRGSEGTSCAAGVAGSEGTSAWVGVAAPVEASGGVESAGGGVGAVVTPVSSGVASGSPVVVPLLRPSANSTRISELPMRRWSSCASLVTPSTRRSFTHVPLRDCSSVIDRPSSSTRNVA